MREGERFGAYELIAKLADGGMAEIFRARKLGAKGFSREVCIKCIKPAMCRDRTFVEMFIDEAHTSSKLRHSNIVAIDDFGELDGRLFACMEWVNGTDLAHMLKRLADARERVPTDAALFIVGEVLKALEYAHGKIDDGKALDIVHRDVTPHNVLVSFSGEVKLTDFGIAKANSRLHQTQGDVVKGKISYMAPEQARGLSLDGRVDLFALGVVAFELLAGRRPFVGAREGDVVNALLRNDRPALRALRPELPVDVERFVDRMLAPSREARFPNATVALDVLSTLTPSTGARTLANLLTDYYPDRASVVRDGASLRKHVPTPVKVAAPPKPLEATIELAAARAIPEKTVSESLQTSMPTDPAPPPDVAEDDRTAVDRTPAPEAEVTDDQRLASFDAVPSERMLLERARTDRVATATSARPHEAPDASRSAVTVTTLKRAAAETPDAPPPALPSEPPPETPSRARNPWLIAALVPLFVGVVGFFATRRPPSAPQPAAVVSAAVVSPPVAAPAIETPPTPPTIQPTPDASAAVAPNVATDDAPATLVVVVRPWGAITVDGRAYGETRASVRLAPGRHRVQGAQGDNARAETLVLRAGERRTVTINMQ